jgi:hypothetical protein
MTQSDPSSCREIAKRIRGLIARNDQGDVTRAAHRLALPVGALCQLERILAESDGSAGANLLAAVIHRYGADASWLLTGQASTQATELEPEMRRTIATLLTDVSDRIIADYRARQPGSEASAAR